MHSSKTNGNNATSITTIASSSAVQDTADTSASTSHANAASTVAVNETANATGINDVHLSTLNKSGYHF